MIKTYVVAGGTYCGTTAMMKAIMAGGIMGYYRELPNSEKGYPHEVYEPKGGYIGVQEVLGKVVKQFGATLIDNISQHVNKLYVVYMVRNQRKRLDAHPDETEDVNYWYKHAHNIEAISQCPRVKKIVIVDFDHLKDDPTQIMVMLSDKGWDIDEWKAACAIGDGPYQAPATQPVFEAQHDPVNSLPSPLTIEPGHEYPTDEPSLRIIEHQIRKRNRIAR